MLVVFDGQGIGSSWRFCPRQPGLCVCIRWCVLSRAPISFGVFNRLSTDKFELGCSELRVHGQCSLGFSLTRRALRVNGQYSLTADNDAILLKQLPQCVARSWEVVWIAGWG